MTTRRRREPVEVGDSSKCSHVNSGRRANKEIEAVSLLFRLRLGKQNTSRATNCSAADTWLMSLSLSPSAESRLNIYVSPPRSSTRVFEAPDTEFSFLSAHRLRAVLRMRRENSVAKYESRRVNVYSTRPPLFRSRSSEFISPRSESAANSIPLADGEIDYFLL